MNSLSQLLEAALFSATHPLSLSDLAALDPDVSHSEIMEAMAELKRVLDGGGGGGGGGGHGGHGVELLEVAEGFQILTRQEFADAIHRARIVTRPRRLSPPALETLAIIAYRQPVGRAEIEEIRGVAADGVLRLLLERELVRVVGRGDGLGRPLLYGTTPRFLDMLGINSIDQLPNLEEFTVKLSPARDLTAE